MDDPVHTLLDKISIPRLGSISVRVELRPGLQEPQLPVVILGHGAGNDMQAPLLVGVQKGLAERGVCCVVFNFLYSEARRRAPDPLAVLQETFRQVVTWTQGQFPSKNPPVLGGKSLGGRVASHLVADGVRAAGLVFLGYPLHPAGRPEQLRTGHWAKIRVPLLFVQGTRDPLCQLPLLQRELSRWQAVNPGMAKLETIEGGDHSFVVPRSAGIEPNQVYSDIARRVFDWLRSTASPTP